MIRTILSILLGVVVFSCDAPKNTYEKEEEQTTEIAAPEAMANMGEANTSGTNGTVKFVQKEGYVLFTLNVSPITPGNHAVHIHENGDCSAADASSAGGHWNPTDEPHGQRGVTTNFHAGDIDNMQVGPDSVGYMERKIDEWNIGEGDDMDVLGKAVIIHAGADDFTSQPSGAAGPRIACGVIQQTK